MTLRIFLPASLEICFKINNKSLKVIRKNLVKKVREFDGKNLVFVTKERLELPEDEGERRRVRLTSRSSSLCARS